MPCLQLSLKRTGLFPAVSGLRLLLWRLDVLHVAQLFFRVYHLGAHVEGFFHFFEPLWFYLGSQVRGRRLRVQGHCFCRCLIEFQRFSVQGTFLGKRRLRVRRGGFINFYWGNVRLKFFWFLRGVVVQWEGFWIWDCGFLLLNWRCNHLFTVLRRNCGSLSSYES